MIVSLLFKKKKNPNHKKKYDKGTVFVILCALFGAAPPPVDLHNICLIWYTKSTPTRNNLYHVLTSTFRHHGFFRM